MDDLDLAAALGQMPDEEPDESPTPETAAASDDDATDFLTALEDLSGDALAGESEPEPEAAEADPLAATEDADEDDLPTLKARLAEYEQARRDAEAQLAEQQARTYWSQREQQADAKLSQALEWLQVESERAFDSRQFLLDQLPHIIQGYAADKEAIARDREAAWERIARQHGSQTYRQTVQQQFALSDAEMQRIATNFAPEQWQGAAQLLSEAKAPIKQELTTTKGKLTKAERAVHAQRLKASRVEPGTGRATATDLRDLRDKVTGGDAELPAILRLVGAV